jgi:Outer membrane protein beta-barrel domain
MKKIGLLLCFSVFLLGKAEAQKGIRFGFQSSPTWSWLKTSDPKIEGVSSNWGLKVGAICEYYFEENYALTTGLGFGLNQGGSLQNGYPAWKPWDKADLAAIPSDTFGLNSKLHYGVTYVEIPFGLKMRGGSNEDSRVKFYAELPIFTLGFVNKASGNILGTADQNLNDVNIREEVKGISLSWGLGGGIEYEVATNTRLVAGLAFQKQFTDLTRNGSVEESPNKWVMEDSKGTFGSIALKIGVFF